MFLLPYFSLVIIHIFLFFFRFLVVFDWMLVNENVILLTGSFCCLPLKRVGLGLVGM